MAFIVDFVVREGIRSDDTFVRLIEKDIDIGFQDKLVFNKTIFLIDMEGISCPANLYDKLEIPGDECKIHKIRISDVEFVGRHKILADKLIDQPATINDLPSLLCIKEHPL